MFLVVRDESLRVSVRVRVRVTASVVASFIFIRKQNTKKPFSNQICSTIHRPCPRDKPVVVGGRSKG